MARAPRRLPSRDHPRNELRGIPATTAALPQPPQPPQPQRQERGVAISSTRDRHPARGRRPDIIRGYVRSSDATCPHVGRVRILSG
jgi:hypothetical protein